MHHGLRLLRGARLHDTQQEAHEHGLHHVHLALHQSQVPVRWQPSIPLRPTLHALTKATDRLLGPLEQP